MLLTRLAAICISLSSADDENGQGLAEYALILALIALTAIVALIFMGNQLSGELSSIGTSIQSVAG